jgi:hypothetical protein
MVSGISAMARQSRKGDKTAEHLREESKQFAAVSVELSALAAVMESQNLTSIKIDGVGNVTRAIDQAWLYLAKCDAGLGLARRTRK